MDPEKREYFRNRIQKERDELKRLIEGIEETGTDMSQRESTGELSLYDNHPADVGSEVYERSKDLALKNDAEFKLKAIEDALSKMRAGRYGLCDECGGEIPLDRLEAIPYTTMCRLCKSKEEELSEPKQRSLEEEVFQNPWQRAFDDSIIYDRDDTWQDIEQHSLSTETDPLDEEEGRGGVLGEAPPDVDQIPYYKSDGVFYRDNRV